MKPDVKKILTKLSGKDLKQKKLSNVELSVVGDASKLLSVTKQIIKRLEKDGDAYIKLYQSIQNDGDKLMSYYDTANRLKDKLEQGAKDLGVEPSPVVKLLNDLTSTMRTLRKRLTF